MIVYKRESVSRSVVSDSLRPPWTVALQAPLPMKFSRQEYWSGLPFPSPGDLPDPGIEPGFPTLQADSLPSEPPGKSYVIICVYICVCVYIYVCVCVCVCVCVYYSVIKKNK